MSPRVVDHEQQIHAAGTIDHLVTVGLDSIGRLWHGTVPLPQQAEDGSLVGIGLCQHRNLDLRLDLRLG